MQPKPQLKWRQQAIDDLVEIVEYIAEDNPDAAQALKDERVPRPPAMALITNPLHVRFLDETISRIRTNTGLVGR